MPLSLAYVAGLLDGEGCITINGHPDKVTSAAILVEVGMTKPALPILHQLESQFGGRVRPLRAATDRWAEAWQWTILGEPAAEMLEQVAPMLQLKVEQARAVLQFQRLRCSQRTGLRPKQRAEWTQEALEDGRTFIQRIRELNRKGPDAPASPGQPIARRVAGQWVTDQASLFAASGWEPFSGPWPKSGMTHGGAVYELPTSVPATDASASSSLLPTPAAQEPGGTVEQYHERLRKADGREATFTPLSMLVQTLLPTPAARLGDRWGMPNEATARRRLEVEGRRNLEDAIALLPTPNAADHKRGKGSLTAARSGSFRPGMTLTDWVERHGASTSPPSDAMNEPSDAPPPNPPTNEAA